MRWIGILLLVAVVATSVFAADVATTDKPDIRLDKKVTISVVHAKLEDVVKQLSEQSGVEIKAGTGARDWKVRERKVTIEAKDVRLGTVLEEISKLLGFYLSKSGKKDEWAYTFWQDMKARLLESEMLNAAREAVAQRSVAMRQSALDSASEALKLSPEEAMKKKAEDPWTAYLGGTKSGRGYAQILGYLAGNFPIERDLMLRGKKTTISLESIPPYLQQAIEDTKFGGYMALGAEHMSQEESDMYGGLTASQLTVMPMSGFASDQDMASAGWSGMVMINARLPGDLAGDEVPPEVDSMFGGGMPLAMFPLARSDSLTGKLFGKMLLAIDEGMKEGEMEKLMEDEMGNPDLFAETLALESPTEKEPPTDPEMTREVDLGELPKVNTFEPDTDLPETIGKEVIAVSKAIGKPVLLESFLGSMPMGIFLNSGKQPLYKILIGMEKAGYNWTFGDGTLRLRPDDWALQRSYEIPESTLAKYSEILKNREFSLDDLAGLATELTDGQITNTLMEMPEFTFLVMSMQSDFGGGSRELLRLYGSMSSQQKSAVQADPGLGFSQLSGPQWDRLNVIISDEFGGVYVLDGAIVLTTPEADAEGYPYTFDFTVQVGGEETPRTFSRSITVYGKAMREEMQKSVDEAKKQAETDTPGQDKPIQEQPPTEVGK